MIAATPATATTASSVVILINRSVILVPHGASVISLISTGSSSLGV